MWNTFKELFTVKKTKDLNTTIEKYKLLMEEKATTTVPLPLHLGNVNADLGNVIDIIGLEENDLMENDLNQFISEMGLQNEMQNNIS